LVDRSGAAREAIGIETAGKPPMEFLLPKCMVQAIRFNTGKESVYVGRGP